jgi:PDZ domain-containing secreted protein
MRWLSEHPETLFVGETLTVIVAAILVFSAAVFLVARYVSHKRSGEPPIQLGRMFWVVLVTLTAFVGSDVLLAKVGSRRTLAAGGTTDAVTLIEGDERAASALRKVSVKPYPSTIGFWLMEKFDSEGFQKSDETTLNCSSPLYQQEGETLGVVAAEHHLGNNAAYATSKGVRLWNVPALSAFRDGDVVSAINKTKVQFFADYSAAPRAKPTTFTIDGKTVEVKKGSAGCVGPAGETTAHGVHHRPRVDDSSWGNSASLVAALSIVDAEEKHWPLLSSPVVVSGAITQDGTVVGIGGADLKALSANAEDACLFVVPSENVLEAQKTASVPVVGVKTLDEAIKAIDQVVSTGNCR